MLFIYEKILVISPTPNTRPIIFTNQKAMNIIINPISAVVRMLFAACALLGSPPESIRLYPPYKIIKRSTSPAMGKIIKSRAETIDPGVAVEKFIMCGDVWITEYN